MRVQLCIINVGGGIGNRDMVFDVFSFVDIIFILDSPYDRGRGYVQAESGDFELFSFVEGSGIEVYVRSGITGWVEVVKHGEAYVVIEVEAQGGEKQRIGGVYFRPERGVASVERMVEGLEACDMITGDFNARHEVWGKRAGDNRRNPYGPFINRWTTRYGFIPMIHESPTFRSSSVIDLTFTKGKETRVMLKDELGLEHCAQVIRLNIWPPENVPQARIAWKQVDWKKMEKDLEGVNQWEDIRLIMKELPRSKGKGGKCKWWTEQLEAMSKDVKNLRRSGNKESWKLARRVFRATLIQKRYDSIKENLSKIKDADMFKHIRDLETKRTLPPMDDGEGNIVHEFHGICDLIAQQLDPVEKREERVVENIEIEASMDELKEGLETSPRNTASGVDQVSYPMLRFWFRKDPENMLRIANDMLRSDEEEWHTAETVLIPKGDKERYNVVKSWRMIHLLPTMAKVMERVVLAKLTDKVTLGETQYGSRKKRSTHDAMKQIMDFMDYTAGKERAILSMDVEGGFDRVNLDILSDILTWKECPRNINLWIRRWAQRRTIRLRFNGRISKEYYTNRGVPQGSPLAPYLFGIYLTDVFSPRIQTRINMTSMVSSYVDDGTIVVASNSVPGAKEQLEVIYKRCNEIASNRGMGFSPSKTVWMGIGGRDKWGKLKLEDEEVESVEKIRVLGYRFDKEWRMDDHVEYWLERGVGVRRRIASIGRRFGSEGGIGSWECIRLIKCVYMPTIYYGLEFINSPALIKRIQVQLNDTIRSTFRTPLRTANNILSAESGIPPTNIEKKRLNRKSYHRHISLEIGREMPWFGSLSEKVWNDGKVGRGMMSSDKSLETIPTVIIPKNKEKAMEEYRRLEEEGVKEGEVWVFTDGSKSGKRAGVAWVKVAGSGLVEEKLGMAVPGEWDIVRTEVCGIGLAISDMRRWKGRKLVVFTDCIPAITKIRDMRSEGSLAGLWDRMAMILNEWHEVEIRWVAGHQQVHGNEIADQQAKMYRQQEVMKGGRWTDMDYEGDWDGRINEMAREDWLEWHKEEGHDYYTRLPMKPKHLKHLSRLDMYVLIRLRTGACKKGHDECLNVEFRHHLALCPKYDNKRPELETLYDDKHLPEWKEWWIEHEYLQMGIPTGTVSSLEVRVMYGNPFDGTIMIEKNGSVIKEIAKKPPCDGCGKTHEGPCLKEIDDLRGRWFYINKVEMNCLICGGKYGGGSTSRPGGSGLKDHLNKDKFGCGRKWEIKKWGELVDEWEGWSESYRNALVIKWSEIFDKKNLKCWECDKAFNSLNYLRKHVRGERNCFEKLEVLVKENPAGRGEWF